MAGDEIFLSSLGDWQLSDLGSEACSPWVAPRWHTVCAFGWEDWYELPLAVVLVRGQIFAIQPEG